MWHKITLILLEFLIFNQIKSKSNLISNNNKIFSKLIHRQSSSNNFNYPPIDLVGPTPKPEWLIALNKEKKAGRIPNLKPSYKTSTGTVQYQPGLNPTNISSICSWTLGCISPEDINNAPNGMIGLNFDDGPQPGTPKLLNYLKSINQSATHFFIGSRILQNQNYFMAALNQGTHIAAHTWSHPLMTTLNDTAVLGEIGWSMQIIFDLSGGKLPAYWRPPFGDVDNRVRAIAKNVFGLQTVIWNQDTDDWCLSPDDKNICGGVGPANEAALNKYLANLTTLPKSPGLIILEHELTEHSVNGFINSYQGMRSAGWDLRPIPGLFNQSWYQNAQGPFDDVVPLNSILNASTLVAAARSAPSGNKQTIMISNTTGQSLSPNLPSEARSVSGPPLALTKIKTIFCIALWLSISKFIPFES